MPAQPLAPGVQIKGFRLPGFDAQNRTNFLLIGAEAIPQVNGQIQIKQLRLETYKTDGRLDFVVEAPECTYDVKQRVAFSPGKLDARTADGRLAISGEGFAWQPQNATLAISNRVHTVIRNRPPTPPSPNP
ncbi:MAG: hypothetical protein HYY24_23530 [Verrucomicrobia bacterium]|nr:hypothetical protein [Verrucomicrobiota bacterium]